MPSGEVWFFYLSSNATPAGVWRAFQFGTGVSSAVAAALAGAGLKAVANTLNVKIAPTLTAATPTNILSADRAEAFVWTGGVGAFNLPTAAAVGSDWFVMLRNSGSGTVTVTPAAGLINGAPSLALSPSDSAIVFTDGLNYYTVGFGQSVAGLFDFVSVSVAGPAGDYVLSGTELNRISYRLTGALTGARNVVVPTAVQQYWVDNQTSGAFSLTVKTLAGTGVVVPQGQARILYCDGTNVVWANTVADPLAVGDGGTGLTTVAQGDLLYGSAADVYSLLPKSASATRYLSNTGAANNPAWGLVDLTNGVTGQLPHANIANVTGTSVFGRASNSAGIGGSIAGTNSQVLRVNSAGTVLGFGQVDLAAAAAVVGTLPAGNGGTGIATYAQGDTLYSDAADSLAKLAKHTTFKRPLMNTGASNNPAWGPLEIFVQTPLAASYTLDADDPWVLQYESSGTTGVEIPENASVAFPVGTIIPFVNDAGAGAMTFTPLGAAVLNVQGSALSNPDTFDLPPGYSAILWKVATDVWQMLTDAPSAGSVNTVYSGYVDSGATAEQVPAGWSVANTGTGLYTVTHNLGLASGNDLSVALTLIRAVADDTYINVIARNANDFTLGIVDSGSGATDSAFFFIAKRNV